MKKLAKFILAFTISIPFMTSADASDAYYGLPQKTAHVATGKNLGDSYSGYVTLYNHTPQTYIANGTFYPSGKSMNNLLLNPVGSIDPASGYPSDTITYDISYPDTYVCISAMRYTDHVTVLPTTCRRGGFRIDIGPGPVGALNNTMPTITIR